MIPSLFNATTCADPENFFQGGGGGPSDSYLSFPRGGAYFWLFYNVKKKFEFAGGGLANPL